MNYKNSYNSFGWLIFNVVVVNFNQSSYEVMEDDGSVTIMILLSQVSLVQFEVGINPMDLTATGNNV